MSGERKANPSNFIRSTREAAGWSREELAFKAGVSLRTIERIEAGTVEPQRSTLAVIEQALTKTTRSDSPSQAATGAKV